MEGSRQLSVEYEELVAEPAATLRRVSEFLEVEFEPEMQNPYADARSLRDPSGVQAALGDPNFLTHDRVDPSAGESWKRHELPRELAPETQKLALELGYELA